MNSVRSISTFKKLVVSYAVLTSLPHTAKMYSFGHFSPGEKIKFSTKSKFSNLRLVVWWIIFVNPNSIWWSDFNLKSNHQIEFLFLFFICRFGFLKFLKKLKFKLTSEVKNFMSSSPAPPLGFARYQVGWSKNLLASWSWRHSVSLRIQEGVRGTTSFSLSSANTFWRYTGDADLFGDFLKILKNLCQGTFALWAYVGIYCI